MGQGFLPRATQQQQQPPPRTPRVPTHSGAGCRQSGSPSVVFAGCHLLLLLLLHFWPCHEFQRASKVVFWPLPAIGGRASGSAERTAAPVRQGSRPGTACLSGVELEWAGEVLLAASSAAATAAGTAGVQKPEFSRETLTFLVEICIQQYHSIVAAH